MLSLSTQPDVSPMLSHEMLITERSRLVQFCSYLTATPAVAEDLAQETLLEAWRNKHKFSPFSESPIEQQTALRKWLFAIARNVCLRWQRKFADDRAHMVSFSDPLPEDGNNVALADTLHDPFDIEIELERDELAILLDRALELLPSSMRQVLIERFIYESSYATIAEKLGLGEAVIAQRVRRGKLALRRIFAEDLKMDALTYGLVAYEENQQEQKTRIWCPMCNRARLISYTLSVDWKGFRCPACWHIAAWDKPEVWAGLCNPKGILNRQIGALGAYYWQAIEAGRGLCPLCHSSTLVEVVQPQDIALKFVPSRYPCVHIVCKHCSYDEYNSLPHLTLDIPETTRFWHKHPRMYWLPPQKIDYRGSPAFVCSFQSANDTAHLDIILDSTSLHLLGVQEA
jgi:RNA polymerase sigma factor (sigma-70 family)